MSNDRVRVDPRAEENGMACMTAELLRSNIAGSRYKLLCFRMLKANVGLRLPDAEVSATLAFNRGECVFYDGIDNNVDFTIEADSEDLLALSNINLIGGLPNFFDETGRALLAKGRAQKVKMTGVALHPLSLLLLTIVLSVN